MKKMVQAFVRDIKEQPQFKDSWIIFLPENNLGLEASHLASFVSKIHKVYTYSDKEDRIGVGTTYQRKFEYVEAMEAFLLPADTLRYNVPFVSANPFVEASKRELEIKKKLYNQLGMFRKLIHLPQQAYSIAKITLSGKVDPEGKQSNRFQDDVAMALMIAIYWGDRWRKGKCKVPYDHFG
jgi:hypothetical protein